MPEDPRDEPTRLQIDWLKTAAGALAAVSSAIVLSSVGVAGTLVGAAVGSVIFTISSSLYSTGLDRSRRRMTRAQAAAAEKLGVAQAEVRRAARRRASGTAVVGHLEHADEQLVEAKVRLDAAAEEEPEPWLGRLTALPWKRITLVALGLFAVAVVLITAFEVVAGRPVSSFTGGTQGGTGTSVTDLGGSSKPHRPTPSPTPALQPSATPTHVPTFQTTPTQAPTPSPTVSTTPSPTSPAPSPTASPSASSTASPTTGAS